MAMTYEENRGKQPRPHSLTLSERRRLAVSGVDDVESFDEEAVNLATAAGTLAIRGSGLRIEKLSLDGGELVVEGKIDCLDYSDAAPARRGLLGRLLG